MKRIFILVVVLCGFIACKKDKPTLDIIWQDNFETYNASTFPNSWIADGNSSDLANNNIDNSISHDGEKSLKLFGVLGSCWAGIAYHSLAVTPPFEIEIAVRNGDESLSGCHLFRGWVGLNKGTSWTNPTQRYLILFDSYGKILGGGGTELRLYNNDTWYLTRVRYEITSTSEIKLSYWIDNVYLGSESISAINDENLLSYLEIQGVEGSVWFDVVKIYK
jgi:hypothetical protein